MAQLTKEHETLLSSEVAWKIARHIAGKNSDYFSMREGLAELESIINLHFANAALSSAATAIRDKCVEKVRGLRHKSEPDDSRWNAALYHAETQIQSLTLDQVKPEKQC